eukprot:scaffold3449_cov339-Prasinococcus_capsulatus_cf.AAC.10
MTCADWLGHRSLTNSFADGHLFPLREGLLNPLSSLTELNLDGAVCCMGTAVRPPRPLQARNCMATTSHGGARSPSRRCRSSIRSRRLRRPRFKEALGANAAVERPTVAHVFQRATPSNNQPAYTGFHGLWEHVTAPPAARSG